MPEQQRNPTQQLQQPCVDGNIDRTGSVSSPESTRARVERLSIAMRQLQQVPVADRYP